MFFIDVLLYLYQDNFIGTEIQRMLQRVILGNFGQKLSQWFAYSFNNIQPNAQSHVSHVFSKAPYGKKRPPDFSVSINRVTFI